MGAPRCRLAGSRDAASLTAAGVYAGVTEIACPPPPPPKHMLASASSASAASRHPVLRRIVSASRFTRSKSKKAVDRQGQNKTPSCLLRPTLRRRGPGLRHAAPQPGCQPAWRWRGLFWKTWRHGPDRPTPIRSRRHGQVLSRRREQQQVLQGVWVRSACALQEHVRHCGCHPQHAAQEGEKVPGGCA